LSAADEEVGFVLFALVEPVAFVALVIAFLLGLVLRAVAIRVTARRLGLAPGRESAAPRLREDIDPFGAVAAALGGVGWGRMLSVDEVPRQRGRGRAAAVFAAGPLTCLVVAQLFFLTHKLAYPDVSLAFIGPADVLFGLPAPYGAQVLLSLAVGLLAFGLLALIPIPPLDGFGLLWNALRRPGSGMQWMRLWFEEKNVGVLILLVCSLFPLGAPFLARIIAVPALLFVSLWG
jgi:Zn-dependent protease